jgi:hypothetical protein
MGEVFIGSEAVAAGRLTEHELRRWYRSIFRDVYVPKHAEPSLRDRTVGAWLWSRRQAVITGAAASALHGADWVDTGTPIELLSRSSRPQSGILVRNERTDDNEVTVVAGLPVATAVRTAFDLGRHLPKSVALARLDALARATPFTAEDVLLMAKRYPGARGVRRLRAVLPLIDAGAQSPKESWLRLVLVDAGLPTPTTQIPVLDGYSVVALLDMGWEEFKVAVEYDGDQHRSDRRQYVRDMRRLSKLEGAGWIVVRVIAEDRPDDIVDRVLDAFKRRGLRRNRR